MIDYNVAINYKNFPMVPRVVFGRGSFNALHHILLPKRKNSEAPFVFLVDDVFECDKTFTERIPVMFNDVVIYVSADEEPKTEQVDFLATAIKNDFEEVSGVIGIGGGTLMDLAKAVAIMLTNKGAAEDYQGWDLVKRPAIYHVGIPTLSGTGAEVSRTTVLTGSSKKLGINSDFTPFDQVVLDPELTSGVPKKQWFYSGMDCFVHCVESLNGTFLNAFSQSYGEKAYDMCKEVFLKNTLSKEDIQDKLMMASWHGGMSIAYSQVGVAHAVSYGLSYVLGVKHGLGNCLVFDQIEEFYPGDYALFQQMKSFHEVNLPKNICSGLSDNQFDTMINVSLVMEPLWENALGKNWKDVITRKKLRSIYEKL